ncbi:MAG: hypothetical protein CL920_24585 [Deltaproteobacteria bacterium]|nr:hypothetical protein [Deltaproteobacteria bacterium]
MFLRSKSINILVRYGCFGLALLWYMGSAGAVTQGTESETKKANCKNYEIVSLGQQQRNLKLKCGYFGAMWHSNAGSHYKWCYASPLESSKNVLADEQIKLRKEMLASCAKKESVKTICKRYARAVVTAIKQNRKRRCGDVQRHTAWSASYSTQLKFCAGISGKKVSTWNWVAQQLFYHRALLARCSACQHYAKRSVAQYKTAQQKKCGYGPNDRWNGDIKRHFRVCSQWYGDPRHKAKDWNNYSKIMQRGLLKFKKDLLIRKRQVHVCRTKKTYQVCLKSTNNHYVVSLGDKLNVRADRKACKGWEIHTLVDVNGGTLNHGDAIYIRTAHKHYWSAQPSGILQANRTEPWTWEQFRIYKVSGKGRIANGTKIAIKSAHKRWLAAYQGGGQHVLINRTKRSSWETFTLRFVGAGTTAKSKRAMVAGVFSPRRGAEVFFRGQDGFLRYSYVHGGRRGLDTRTFRRGGKVQGGTSAVYSPRLRHAQVFYRGVDGYLHHFFFGRGWGHEVRAFRQGGKIQGAISSLYAPQRKRSEVFVVARNGDLQYYYFAGGRWRLDKSTFRQGGKVKGAVSATYASHRRHAEVFFRGRNNRLRYFFLHNGRWMMDANTFRNAPVTGTLSAIYHKKHRHSEVFFRGKGGYLNRYYFHRGWHFDHKSFRGAGRVSGDISVVYDAKRGQPSGFFRGADGYLRFFYMSGGRWRISSRSFRRGAKVKGKISAVYSKTSKHPEVFYQGDDGRVHFFSVRRGGWALQVFPW